MSRRISRRSLLKGAAAGGAGFLFLRDSRLAFGYEANGKLNVACIGCGGRGGGNIDGVASENIVALCDVDENQAKGKREKFPDARFFTDFRVMLDRMGRQIDAVVVSTPDHTHAVAAAMALRMGKHVYCEKPLTHTIHEARVLRDLARKAGVATQMGNQGTASSGMRESVEVLRAGAIGQVYEIHVWSNRPVWPQGIQRPADTPPVPGGLHWDLWLGPMPYRPYHPAYHPFNWRGWKDFGTGAIGDMGCHTVNMPFMALDLRDPIAVEAETFEGTEETYPKRSIVRYSFGARGSLRPLRMYWYDGGLKPSPELLFGRELPGSGVVLVGEKGLMFSPDDYGGQYELLPAERFADFRKPEPSLPRSPGHHAEWIRACKGGEPAMSNFDYAAALTETMLLGNLAVLVGEPIYWDSARCRAINCPKAEYYVNMPYRKGWRL